MRSLLCCVFLVLGAVCTEAFVPPSTTTTSKCDRPALVGVNRHRIESKIALNLSAETTTSDEDESTTTITTSSTTATDSDLELLQDALLAFQSDSAKKVLNKLRELRSTSMDASVDYVNGLLEEGPDRPLPLWAKTLPLLSRYSKRARLASLKRTLDMTTPPPEEDDSTTGGAEITTEDKLRRRRRALVALLQSLAAAEEEEEEEDATSSTTGTTISRKSSNRPAIRILEKKARKEQNQSASTDNRADMLRRRPADLETPNYTVVYNSKDYEIRAYDSFSVCSVEMNQARPADSYRTDATASDPKMAGARAFGALAGYLFGKNQQESAMKMTTPVLTSNYGTENKQMSFVLPSEYWRVDSLEAAPKPLDGSGVSLQIQPPSNCAVAMFGGYAAKSQVEKQKKAMLEALSKDKEWEVIPAEEVALAQYNDPFTPPWKRLNEVSVKVQPKQ